MTLLDELDFRRSAIAYIDRHTDPSGTITRAKLSDFWYDGERFPLLDTGRGIRNPARLAATLSILSTPKGPYEDAIDPIDGLLRYAYQRGPIDGGDNRKLRAAAQLAVPLILFEKVADAVFVARMPIYIVSDHPEGRYVKIAVDEALRFAQPGNPEQRQYVERLTRMRLHQPVFRARVLAAYSRQCAICRLKHVDLLDAAHIVGDAESGQPTVDNGLSLCKIHHAAYDRGILGVRPDYVVQVRGDVLLEVDGPMLRHGLQDVHGWRLELPKRLADRPGPDLLAQRWAAFYA